MSNKEETTKTKKTKEPANKKAKTTEKNDNKQTNQIPKNKEKEENTATKEANEKSQKEREYINAIQNLNQKIKNIEQNTKNEENKLKDKNKEKENRLQMLTSSNSKIQETLNLLTEKIEQMKKNIEADKQREEQERLEREKERENNKKGKIKKSSEVEVSNILYKGRNFFKASQYKKKNTDNQVDKTEKSVNIPYLRVFEEENEDIKKSKNFTHINSKNNNFFSKKRSNDQMIIINQSYQIEEKDNKEISNNIYYYLYGIDRNNYLHIFDISNKRWITSKKIFEINCDKNAESFRKDYQYEGTLLYNLLTGVYILTGDKTDTLYFYNSYTESISKICKLKNGHNNGSIKYDEKNKHLYFLGGKNTTNCEYYSLKDKKIYQLPNLIKDRANASFAISEGKLFGFFGFCYSEDNYVNSIEFLDLEKLDKWEELKGIKFLKDNILFNVESVATMYYKNDTSKILIYCGIQGEDEEFVTDYYLIYNTTNNTMDKIDKWELNQFKNVGQFWNEYKLNESDPKGFHFAKNSNFILLDESYSISGYNKKRKIDILIDYKNNVHLIFQDKEKIDIYRGEL